MEKNKFRQILCKWIDSENEYHCVAIHPIHMDFDVHFVYANFGEINGKAFTVAVEWSEIQGMSFDFFDMDF